jgi:hypothetical protein
MAVDRLARVIVIRAGWMLCFWRAGEGRERYTRFEPRPHSHSAQ